METDLGPYHYRFRYYSGTGMYLASSSDGNVYYLGPGDSKPVNVGPLTNWLKTAACQ
jgi:hypothetical protein